MFTMTTALALALSASTASANAEVIPNNPACARFAVQIHIATNHLADAEAFLDDMLQEASREDGLRAVAAHHIETAELLIHQLDELRDQTEGAPMIDPELDRHIGQLERLIEREVRAAEEVMQVLQFSEADIAEAERRVQHRTEALEKAEQELATCDN